MIKRFLKVKNAILSGSLLLMLNNQLYAYYLPAQRADPSLGSSAGNMLTPVGLLRHGLSLAGVLIGVYFLMSAYFRFQRFRQNPQETPISSVITYIILGLIFIILPLVFHYSVKTAGQVGMSDVSP